MIYLRILEMGTPMGVIKFVAEWIAKKDFDSIHKVASSYFLVYFAIGCINFILFILIANFGYEIIFENLSLEEWQTFRIMLIIAAFSSFISYFSSLFKQLLTGSEEIVWISKVDVFKKFLELLLIITIYSFPEFISLIQYYLLIQIISFISLPLLMHKWSRIAPIRKTLFSGWYGKYFMPVLKYGLGIFSIEVFRVSYLQLRPIILQMRSTVDEVTNIVGQLGILITITSILNIAAGSLMTVLVPAFSRILSKEHNTYSRNLRFINYTKKFTAVLILPISILIVISPSFLEIYLGKDYIFLTPYLRIWLAFSCLNIVTTIYTSAIFAIGHIKQFFWFTFSNSTISTLVIWILAPDFNLWAAVIGTSFYFLMKFSFFLFYYSPRILNLHISEFASSVLPSLTTGIITIAFGFLILYYFPFDNNFVIISVISLFLFFIYLTVYFLFFIPEKRQFVKLLKEKITD
jgi:O-antigen/teichoic acid export membrane protein